MRSRLGRWSRHQGKWSRYVLTGLVGLATAVAVGCSGSESPTAPTGEAPRQLLTDALSNLNLLSCSKQPYASTTKTIGTAGGTISVGTHKLVIPSGALATKVTIKAEQISGSVNSVRLSPEGLKFAKPASLTMSYSNCSSLTILKKIVYTDEQLRLLELIPSIDNVLKKTVTGSITHFSRYAVAW